jgi:flavin reductase (DIM6/NTAB) family NADH-FMN oxidoreductase RutF
MTMLQSVRRALARRILGGPLLPQSGDVGLSDPDSEVSVWLHGEGEPVDVTTRYSIACAEPLTLCIATEPGRTGERATLLFRDRRSKETLGEILLALQATITEHGPALLLFRARGASNFCIPPVRLGAHYLLHAYADFVRANKADAISFLSRRALAVAFIRPHPVALVSAQDSAGGNMWPMNLTGTLGADRVGLALQVARHPSKLVASVKRIAITTVPMAQAAIATKLSSNHRVESIDFTKLPFETSPTPRFGIPAPRFALRVREVEIEAVRPLGSHAFIVGKVVSDDVRSRDPALCTIHGFYQGWREANGRATKA